jgi:hypothetical protein
MFNKKNIKFFAVIFIAGLMAVAMSYQWGIAHELKGRDFMRLGKISTVEGDLVRLNAEEWALQVGNVRYDLHMGPGSFRDYHKFVLKEGSSATVKGAVYNTDIGVMQIETDGQSIVLRDEAGRPAWAGSSFSKRDSRPADAQGFGRIDNVPEMK